MPDLDFDFYAGGIEDAIIAILSQAMKAAPLNVRELTTYSGELDPDNLKKAIASRATMFPLVMISYADGEDTRLPATSSVLGKPLHYRHDCSYAVICADNNPMGERTRRRSKVYGMIAKVRKELTGRRLTTVVGEGEDAETIQLTHEVLEPVANEYIMRLPDITAYAVIFKTFFNWSSPDRTQAGTPVSELVLGVGSNNSLGQPGSNLPGTTFES
jgi:hypothetical protein